MRRLILFLIAGFVSIHAIALELSRQLDQCLTNLVENPFHYLSEETVVWLDEMELDKLSNFVYSRSEAQLKDTSLQFYFNQSDVVLTDEIKESERFYQATEYNLALIYAFRTKHSIDPFVEGTLTGDWQEGTCMVGSGSSNLFSFYAGDRSFSYISAAISEGNRLSSYSGFYVLDSSSIELEIRFKKIWVGGEFVPADDEASENDLELVDGKLVLVSCGYVE